MQICTIKNKQIIHQLKTKKMKTQITKIALCLFVVLTTIACKKENQNIHSNAIASGWWQKTAQTSTNNSTGETDDAYASLRACEKDDLLRFNTDGTISSISGAQKCLASESDEIDYAGNWNITDNKLTLDFGLRLTNGEILINNSTTLRVAFPNAFGFTGYTLTMTYTKR